MMTVWCKCIGWNILILNALFFLTSLGLVGFLLTCAGYLAQDRINFLWGLSAGLAYAYFSSCFLALFVALQEKRPRPILTYTYPIVYGFFTCLLALAGLIVLPLFLLSLLIPLVGSVRVLLDAPKQMRIASGIKVLGCKGRDHAALPPPTSEAST